MLDCERGRGGGGGGLSGVGVHCSAHPNIMEPPGGGVERGCSPQGQWLCVFKVGLCVVLSETLPLFGLFLLVAVVTGVPVASLRSVRSLFSDPWRWSIRQSPAHRRPLTGYFLFLGPFCGNPKDDCALKSKQLRHASASESLKSRFCPHSGLTSAKHIDLVPCDWLMTDCWFWLLSS